MTPCSLLNVSEESVVPSSGKSRAAFKGGRGACSLAAPLLKSLNLRNADFVDMIIFKVLLNLPFSQNELLKSADDYYIGILRNAIKILG